MEARMENLKGYLLSLKYLELIAELKSFISDWNETDKEEINHFIDSRLVKIKEQLNEL